MKTIVLGLGVVLIIVAGLMYAFSTLQNSDKMVSVTNFDECVAAGNPVMESYPRQCRSADGQLFVEDVPPVQDPNQGLGLQANGCAVAGCSGTLCVSADEAGGIVTTCEYRAEYACYKEASCEPQSDGKCGWTETAKLQRCLNNPPVFEDGGIPQAM